MAKNFKKFLVAVSVAATTVYSLGLAAFVPAANAAVSAGTLVKASGAAVYYVGADMKRYVFPDEKAFKTWYADFSSVVTITDAELASMPIGGNVTYRPGAKMVKITTDPKVYAVDAHGTLRWVTTEAIATCLYGASWGSYVQDVPDPFFVNYTQGNQINACSEFVPASVTAAATSINVDKGLAAGVEGPVLSGGSVMVSLSSDTPASQTVPAGASLEVAKFNLKAGSAAAQISNIKLTSSGLNTSTYIDDVTLYVDGVKATSAKDVNTDNEVSFSFATPLAIPANATKVVSVRATFELGQTGFFALGLKTASGITAGGSVTGSFPVTGNTMQAVAADVAEVEVGTVTSVTKTVEFGDDNVEIAQFILSSVNEDVLFTGASLKNGGTNRTDILSNIKLLIDGAEVATGSYDATSGYISFNINNFLMEEDSNYEMTVVADIGSSDDNDTIKLYVKDRADFEFIGQQLGYGALIKSGAGNFDDINTSTDLGTVTISVGQVAIDFDKALTPAKDVSPETDGVVLATLTMLSKGENATIDAIDGTAGTFLITGNSLEENQTTPELDNVKLVDVATGGSYDADFLDTTADGTYNLVIAEEINLIKGVKKTFQVRADLTDQATDAESFYVSIDGTAFTITGDTSNADLQGEITPGSAINSATSTVAEASLKLTTVPLTDKTVVEGAQGIEIYKGLLEAGDVDDVKITSFMLSADASAVDTFDNSNVSQLDLYLNGVLLKTLSNQIVEGGTAVSTVTFNSLSTVNNANVVAAGATVEVKVVARFSSSFIATGTNFVTGMAAAGSIVARSVDLNNTITVDGTFGAPDVTGGVNAAGESRKVTITDVGHLSVELKTTGVNADEDTLMIAGSSTEAGKYIGELVFTTQNEPIKVTDLRLNYTGSNGEDAIASVKLVDGAGVVKATAVPETDGDVLFENVNLTFVADAATSLYISIVSKGVNVDGDTSATADDGDTVVYTIRDADGVEAQGVNSSETLTMIEDTTGGVGTPEIATNDWSNSDNASKTATIVAAKVTSVTNAMSNGTLTGGNDKVIGKFTLTASAGANRKYTDSTSIEAQLEELNLIVSAGAGTSIADVKMYVEGSASNVALEDVTAADVCQTAGASAGDGDVCQFDATELLDIVNDAKFNGTITLVVTADVTTGVDSYLQLSLDDISTGSISVISTDGNLTNSYTDLLLGYTNVSGGTLSN